MPTRHHYQDKLDTVKDEMLKMGLLVKNAIVHAGMALTKRDSALAKSIIHDDQKINTRELLIEDDCVHIIATEQPVARDLRFLISALKTIRDLERIGDYAAHLARLVVLNNGDLVRIPGPVMEMIGISIEMLSAALTAFMNQDCNTAERIRQQDEKVDKLYIQALGEIPLLMEHDPGHIKQLSPLLLIAKYVERMADHVTNICEEIVFMSTGKRRDLLKY